MMNYIERHLLTLLIRLINQSQGATAMLVDNIDGRHGSGLNVKLGEFKFDLIIANIRKG